MFWLQGQLYFRLPSVPLECTLTSGNTLAFCPSLKGWNPSVQALFFQAATSLFSNPVRTTGPTVSGMGGGYQKLGEAEPPQTALRGPTHAPLQDPLLLPGCFMALSLGPGPRAGTSGGQVVARDSRWLEHVLTRRSEAGAGGGVGTRVGKRGQEGPGATLPKPAVHPPGAAHGVWHL